MSVSKIELQKIIEPGILNQMPDCQYIVKWGMPERLVSWNRLDVGMRTLYLNLKNKTPELADLIYYEDLRAQSLGTLVDPDNSSKSDFNIFKSVFDEISTAISINGFDPKKTVLPVSTTGSILNGGHRLSAALVHQKAVAYVQTGLPPITCDYKYFFERAVSDRLIEQAVLQLLKYMENGFVAFLWPSGAKNISKSECLFDNVVYKKGLALTSKGALNLLFQCYHHMEWVGTEENGYRGLYQKLIECFPTCGEVLMIIFQAERGIDQVREIKQKIRDINGTGYSSVHITDTQVELLRLANLLCNENGLHYLNNANLINARHVEHIAELVEQSRVAGVSPENFLLDGSWLLELYGLRKAEDIDIIAATGHQDIYQLLGYDPRDKEIVHHRKDTNTLIYDPENHFYLFGLKFVGFSQLTFMKKNRAEPKDILDVRLMAALIENSQLQILKTRTLQKFLYVRIRSRRLLFSFASDFLRAVGLYKLVRIIYRTLK
jgi:hypothetical protein